MKKPAFVNNRMLNNNADYQGNTEKRFVMRMKAIDGINVKLKGTSAGEKAKRCST